MIVRYGRCGRSTSGWSAGGGLHSNRNREVLCRHAYQLSSAACLNRLHLCRQIPQLWSIRSEEDDAGIVGSIGDGFGGDYLVDSGRHQLHHGREEAYDRSFHC